ncbi:hypothetical protein [Bosea sp. PAMC 26642]|uniref:hypothetical protein n=1 Tax=Bosea sp. (strain PAMC 26642) TaxID=1792307 RepID=UPI001F3FEF2F|nr:hypothetical protein [Bosea sp. PAMC 26642]
MTITRFENGHSKGYPDTWERLGQALEVAGLEFIPEDAKGAGVRYQRPGEPTPAP